MPLRFSRATRLLLVTVAVAAGAGCKNEEDPPTNGSLQLFFQLDAEGLKKAGLEQLHSVELRTLQITAKLESPEFSGAEYVLNAQPGGLLFPAETRLATGPLYEIPPGHVTQLRVYPSEIRLRFKDGSSAPVRLPSGDQTGWKIVVDEERYPEGYEIKSRETTGIKLFLPLGTLFHLTGAGWQARPTIESEQYNIFESAGYDPDKIVVVFRPETPQQRIDQIVNDSGFLVDFAYPKAPPLLYKLDLPPNMGLREAHAYLRGFDDVLAAAPSARLSSRGMVPSEGTPHPLRLLGAETGWASVQRLLGSIGSPSVILAQISATGTNIEHPDLWPNIWLNEAELLPMCGTQETCDVDRDGIITLRDFNAPNFPAGLRPPDVNNDNRVTCRDLLDAKSPYVNKRDDPLGNGNGFVDDICGWNFTASSRFVGGTDDHDTGAAGIMAAPGNEAGPGVGLCWRCRLMVIGATGFPPPIPQASRGATTEILSAFIYARDNGAHIVNFNAGIDLSPEDQPACPKRATRVDRKAYQTVIDEMNAVVAATLSTTANRHPLAVLAGGECNPGIDDGADNYYDWPPEAFAANEPLRASSLVVAAMDNTPLGLGTLAAYSNFGSVFEIAAPGAWTGMLDGQGGITYQEQGTSFAAPTVAGLAGLVASGDATLRGTPNGALLKQKILNQHSETQPDLHLITGARRLTLERLP